MVKLKRGESSSWTSGNPVLQAGQPGYEIDNHRLKIGDGVSNWNELDYISSPWDGGIINNSATIVADGASDLKYWGIQYKDESGNTQNFRINANNSSDYLSLTSSDSRIGTIISVKYDGTSTQFRGSVSNANTITLKQSNIYTTTSSTAGSYGLALKNSDIIGANAVIFADECEVNTEGILFPKQNITSGVGVARSSSDFYTLRGYRGNLYFDGDTVITSSDIAQAKSGNFYVLLANGSSGQRNLGVQFYKDNTLTQLYLMYNSSTNYSALYHSEHGSVISINEETGAMNFNGSAEYAWKLSTSRQIRLTGDVTGSVNTDLSGTVTISTIVAEAPASKITGTLPVAHGGTGATSFTGSRVIVSNSSGNLTVSGITATELNQLDGISTSRTIQKQLDGKAASSHDHSASNITSGILLGARGGTGNDNNTTNTIIVNNRAICYGSFSTGRYNANVAYGNHFYGNVAVNVKWPVTFTSAPIVLLTALGATEGVLNIEVGSRSTTGMTSIRVHRTDAVLDIDPFNICYIACGPTSST